MEPRAAPAAAAPGQQHVVVIGIDRYRAWPRLANAVSDARGAQAAFGRLGFRHVGEPLLDEAATHAALHRLVTEDLAKLGKDDSLVLFFAGHGHTVTTDHAGVTLRRGYILPVDADPGSAGSWLNLKTWLSEVAHLPPRHILVILDACHSGIALQDAAIRYRSGGAPLPEPMESLRARPSRRVITSALDDQLAQDSGPHAGHSLFTGYLIEALTRGLAAERKQPLVTGSDIGNYVQRRVREHARSEQTPDIGTLELHGHGDLIVQLPGFERRPRPRKPAPAREQGSHPKGTRKPPGEREPLRPDRRRKPEPEPRERDLDRDLDRDLAPDPDGAALDPAFVAALDRHAAERARGASVLSMIAGDPTVALAGWAEWAAGRGYLTLATAATTSAAAIEELLAQIPWLRCLPAARASLAAAARRDVDAVDASLDARSGRERSAWIEDMAGLDRQARVSGWLLSALREPRARVPDLATAPVQGGDLLAVVARLAAPIAVLVHHPEPTAPWLERAIRTAAALVAYLPDHAIAVGAPADLVGRVLGDGRQSAALSMARQGVVSIAPRAEGSAVRVRSRAARVLHAALARDPRTAGWFALDGLIPIHAGGPAIEVDLVSVRARLAIEIDGWYHFRDPEGYRAARSADLRLMRAGFFVLRFLAEDVRERLEHIVDEIAVALRGRHASAPPPGGFP
jgi:hypothetical protein